MLIFRVIVIYLLIQVAEEISVNEIGQIMFTLRSSLHEFVPFDHLSNNGIFRKCDNNRVLSISFWYWIVFYHH